MPQLTKAQLNQRMASFHQGRVLVVGDVAIDEMIYGETSRLSREAPVVILAHQKTDILLGAGGNAAHNVSALGAKGVTMVGISGNDYYRTLLLEAMERDGIATEGIVADADRPTTTKTRITGQARQSVRQQIVRIDREAKQPVSAAIENQLLDTIVRLAPSHQALIISDYDLGVVTPAIIETSLAVAKQHGLIVAVDSHRPLSLFAGATIATPNQPEAEENLGHLLSDQMAVNRGGQQLREHAGLTHLLITQGRDGMTLFDNTPAITHIEPFNRSDVFDVTGAGDTVIATLTLALATGATPVEASVLGNLAASIVVKKYGTAVTSIDEMQETLAELDDRLLMLAAHTPVS